MHVAGADSGALAAGLAVAGFGARVGACDGPWADLPGGLLAAVLALDGLCSHTNIINNDWRGYSVELFI